MNIFKKTLKFNLTEGRFQELRLTRIIQLRNIVAHNRGSVSAVFLARAGAQIDKIGERAKVSNLYAVQNFLTRTAIRLDSDAATKFELETSGDGTPLPL